jgi:hypothetical protein
VGASTDAARARVLAARGQLEDEVARLEAAGRAAVDIPAKVRREPARTAGLAAGAAFLVAGGPRRVIRRVRRAIQGPEADLPKSMLPKEVDRELTKLGRDGDKVRGTLEREFAKYLDEHRDERESRDLGAVTALLLSQVAKPLTQRAARRLVEELFSPEGGSFQEALARLRSRDAGSGNRPAAGGSSDAGAPAAGGSPLSARADSKQPRGQRRR